MEHILAGLILAAVWWFYQDLVEWLDNFLDRIFK